MSNACFARLEEKLGCRKVKNRILFIHQFLCNAVGQKGLANTNISIQKKILEICSERGDEIRQIRRASSITWREERPVFGVNKVGGIVVQSKVAEVFFFENFF